jgi:2-polyprenyl-6-methoxyphenol hydroxylase-like FAD-dependent oxidoreductase
MPAIDMPNEQQNTGDCELYYVLMTFRSDGEEPAYLGKAPLEATDDGVCIHSQYRSSSEPAVQRGTVPFPWGGETDRVPVPATVDTTDPFSLAPMVAYFNRPYGPHSAFVDACPETVHVYRVDAPQKKTLADFDCVATQETNEENQPGDSTGPDGSSRYLEWDDDIVPTVVADETPGLGDAAHVVGFTDGQDMHDPYTHIGVSGASSAAHALRDVMNRNPMPLWDPEVLPVLEGRSFPAGHVFTNGVPAPKPDADSE